MLSFIFGASLLAAFLVFPIWAIIRIRSLGRENDELSRRIYELKTDFEILRNEMRRPASPAAPQAVPEPTPTQVPATSATPAATPLLAAASPSAAAASALPTSIPPALPSPPPQPAVPPSTAALPPPIPKPQPSYASPEPAQPHTVRPRINWEEFMGAKLFAWLGGVAAFLGAALFVKFSFEHDLIPPEVRVALGFIFAIGLIVGGLKIPRDRYATTSQTLIATGIVSLYAVTFACSSIYHFAFFGTIPTFLLMSLITATAFLLAVRLNARVIAVIGIFGGFLTPILLSTGRDNPAGLFGYIALLDIGLIAVALHRRWAFLIPLGTAGTVLMQVGWAAKFLNAEKAPVAIVVTLGFSALLLASYLVGRRTRRGSTELTWCAVALPFVALAFAAALLTYPSVAVDRPWLWFGFIVLADLCLLTLAWCDENLPKLHVVAGSAVFLLLAVWTFDSLTTDNLGWALAMYLVFAALHSVYPLILERHRPASAPTWWSHLFPALGLLLMFGPLMALDSVPVFLWACVLIVDLLAVAVILFTGSLAAMAAMIVLTLAATALWFFRMPVTDAPTFGSLGILAGFIIILFAASMLLARRFGQPGTGDRPLQTDTRAQLPAFSSVLPFALLVMLVLRLPFANPSPIFGLSLLLVVLTLGVCAIMRLAWLPACALVGSAAVEYAWHSHGGTGTVVSLGWYLAFAVLFAVFPFLFRRRFAPMTGPWAVSALGWVVAFPLVFAVVQRTSPNDFPGILPALFAIPALLSLAGILRTVRGDEPARLNQLAWYGGVALLFITLIIPIQFERQWITVGWALEGAALLWLFHRVPHPGLRATGVVLLFVAFVRLALNPAVLEYHARSETALLNWYLYAYGIVTVALFAGARLLGQGLRSDRSRVLGINAVSLLNTLGVILAFLLLNIEIADYFSDPGAPVLTFKFSGNFARDMTYTIAWAVFALALLLISIWKRLRAGRWGALALLGAAILKLFLHDLARLESLYRIGALFAVALVAIVASVAYQRFLPSHEKDSRSDS